MAKDTAQPWPAFAGWLTPDLHPVRKAIVVRAFADLGICETPAGSNRSGRIDAYNRRAEVDVGSYWCQSEACAVWGDCHVELPLTGRASTDLVLAWARETKRYRSWKDTPVIGDMVFYGDRETLNPHHVGLIIRVVPYRLSIEGNTGWGGTFSRNGECCTLKNVENYAGGIIGYASPFPLSQGI